MLQKKVILLVYVIAAIKVAAFSFFTTESVTRASVQCIPYGMGGLSTDMSSTHRLNGLLALDETACESIFHVILHSFVLASFGCFWCEEERRKRKRFVVLL